MEWSKREGSSCTCYCSAASWNFGWTQELGYSFLLSSLHYVCKKAVKQYNSVHVWSCGELLMTPVGHSVERILCETEPDYRGIIRQWTHQNGTARLVGLDILTPHMCVCFSHPDLALTSFLCAVSFAKRLAQEFPMWQVITIFEFPFMALKWLPKFVLGFDCSEATEFWSDSLVLCFLRN
jgi:hypothetical protein